MKKVVALILMLVLCVSLASCGGDRSASIEAIKAKLDPIMEQYGVEEYDIRISVSERYEIICPTVESLRDEDICSILKEAIALGDMDNMEEEGEMIRFSGNIYPDTNEESDYYYYVNSAQAKMSDRSSAGLYNSKNHSRCVYAE